MEFEWTSKTHTGRVREKNEDASLCLPDIGLFVVCDGMGGHKAGAKASRLAVSTIRYMYTYLDQKIHSTIAVDLDDAYKDLAARLVSSVRLANRHIYNKAHKNKIYKGMGTTISALAFKESIACICHVGDSRIYRCRSGKIELLTEDHSWVNELIQDNEIKKEDAFQFEKKNVITRALGLAPTVKIDLKLEPAKTGDLFLLCSDGLTNSLSDNELKNIVLNNQHDLDFAATQLIDTANDKDGSDNITVAFVNILEKNSFDKTFLPVSITLKPESNAISSLENRILRHQFSNRSVFNKILNKINTIWEKRYPKFIIITLLLLITILFVKYSFTDHKKNKPIPTFEELNESAKHNSNSNVNQNKINQTSNERSNTKLTSSSITDNSVTYDSLKNNVTQNEKILTRSLNKTSRNRGLIYLVGLEHLAKNQKTLLYLNNRLLGNTNDFFENGIRVRPGRYDIAIKDSNKMILCKHQNIWISAGDIKAIEFRQPN